MSDVVPGQPYSPPVPAWRRPRRAYAKDTAVPVRRSRDEVEKMLEGRGCDRFQWGVSPEFGQLVFQLDERLIRFRFPLPKADAFSHTERRGRKVKATPMQQETAHDQACRERWRGLVLSLKAKFVSIDSGIESTEEAFLAHIVMGDRKTVHDFMKGQLEQAYAKGAKALTAGAVEG